MAGVSVVVIGAGVVGLSTAIKAQEAGHSVTIVAEALPGDVKSIHYTSPWAGAHHVSLAGKDARQQRMDRETFKTMWAMSENEAEGCFLRLPQIEYYAEEEDRFRELSQSELRQGSLSGASFTTLTIDTPVYLPYLFQRFLSKGGRAVRAKVQHISQAIDGVFSAANSPPEAVFVCAGLGARSLGGVEDKDVYPIRGQTILVRAPWIRFGRTLSSLDGLWTYIIPRRSGDLCPELVPPEVRDKDPSRQFTIADVEPIILEEGCGLRPARKDGIRLESEVVEGSSRKAIVVHNYGHGGYGYQSSWGSATMALDLLAQALSK
ncbi:hypothetical protein M407DRAFT_16388 [Tulasnella calospora MUT 4182]|uniref:FAD dependent oxidoreductase domain-containing protein n=1 Tax=Tulasnella calospora MUT 4182 TaxID=1051891 RepID=A0A0C3Q1U1_9AGAM|nr:hypothetical protein M407DRAFT_16388 [Tulasnella calospora MUT 4182]